jgi:hypothetical protein
LIAGATAARIQSFIRLSLRHDGTVRRSGKAAIAIFGFILPAP